METSKTFRTFAEARRWETEQRRALDTDTYVKPSKSQTRLGAWLDEYLAGPLRTRIRPRTLKGYGEIVRAVKKHPVAEVPLARLTPSQLEGLYADFVTTGPTGARGLSRSSVRAVHNFLYAALRAAVKDRRLMVNPAADADLPRRRSGEEEEEGDGSGRVLRALSVEQRRTLLEVSGRPPAVRTGQRKNGRRWRYQPPGATSRCHALWHLLLDSGLRPGEALALTWADLDFDRHTVRVTKALVPALARGAGWHIEESKTPQSRRTVEVFTATMESLRQHRLQQEADKLAAGARYRDHGFVFATEEGEPLNLRNVKRRHWWPLLDAAGLPRLRIYDLRHTHASLALSATGDVVAVSQRLGHKSVKMTLDVYAHCLPDQAKGVVARLEAHLAG